MRLPTKSTRSAITSTTASFHTQVCSWPAVAVVYRMLTLLAFAPFSEFMEAVAKHPHIVEFVAGHGEAAAKKAKDETK